VYTDPGLGSILLQVLLGAAVALPLIIGIFWGKVRKLFHREKKNGSGE
jgi:hypothetical protein